MLIGCICSFERTVYFVPHRLPPMGNFYLTELSQAGKPKPMRGYSSISLCFVPRRWLPPVDILLNNIGIGLEEQ